MAAANLSRVPYMLRLNPTSKPETTELMHSCLWSLGTTGTSELASGEIIAGFETQDDAYQAGRQIDTCSVGQEWSFIIEKVNPVTWEPFTKMNSIVVPTSENSVTVEIEAGQVFGHGKHPTTQQMLTLLSRAVDDGDRVLDVGTGSGVLGVVAAALAADVVAIDIDETAVSMALRNAQHNEVDIDCSTASLADIVADSASQFDIVVINVLLPVHVELHQDVRAAVKPGGKILMAGFLASQEESIRALYQPFELVDKIQTLDWVGMAVSPTSLD